MYYGYILNPTLIYTRGFRPRDEQLQWVKEHNSTGLYSYQNHGIYANGVPLIKWNFSNPEDAVLFALKFK